jgi:hypothetical protein
MGRGRLAKGFATCDCYGSTSAVHVEPKQPACWCKKKKGARCKRPTMRNTGPRESGRGQMQRGQSRARQRGAK